MPKSADSQNSFSGGIFSPRVDARVDNPKYKAALRQCTNMIPYTQGPVTRRPGTQYIGTPKAIGGGSDYAVRLIEFIFSPQTTFILEVGHQYIRFYSNGVQVQVAGVPVEVSTPYDANATSAGSPWATDIYGLNFCQINDVVYFVSNKYAPYKLTRLSDTSWTMGQVFFDFPALLDENTTNTVLTPSATSGSITVTASAPAYALSVYYPIGSSVEVTGQIYNCLIPHTSLVGFSFELAAGMWVAANIFQSGHVGSTWQFRTLRNASNVFYTITANGTSSTLPVLGNWRLETTEIWSADLALQKSTDGGTTWATLLTISSRGDTNRTETGSESEDCLLRVVVTNWSSVTSAIPPRVILTNEDSFIPGTFTITGWTSSTVVTASVLRQLNTATASTYWSEAAWSAVRGYPRAIAAYQQRVIYGSSSFEQQRIWGTVTNDLENFDRGNPTPLDTSSFAFDLAAPGRGPILWMLSQIDLFAGFAGAEWVINAGTSATGTSSGAAITPTQVNAVEHSNWGSALNVQPHLMGTAVVFCQRQASNIRQMLFSVYTQKYMSQDITENVSNLTAPGVVSLNYQPQWRGQGNLWAINMQGQLIGAAYDLDLEIYGWHQHSTGADIQLLDGSIYSSGDLAFESLAVIPGQAANDDEVWFVVNRKINGVNQRYIERFNPFDWEEIFVRGKQGLSPDPKKAFYVDSGLTITTGGITATITLPHLPNRYICGLADGLPFGPLLTNGSGQVTIPGVFLGAFGFPGSVIAGIPVPYAVQPMRIDMDPRAGNTQGMNKELSDVFVRVFNSSGGSISNGTSVTNAAGNYQQPVPIPYANAALTLGANNFVGNTADIRVQNQLMIVPGSDPMFIVQGQDAAPLTVVGLFFKYSLESTP